MSLCHKPTMGTSTRTARWGALWLGCASAIAMAASCSSAETDDGTGGAGGSTPGATASSASSSSSSSATGSGGAGGGGCDCSGSPNTPVCDEATGQCVECLPADDPCPQGQYCAPPSKTCEVGCTDDTDCTEETKCDKMKFACVGCTIDTECPQGSICTAGQCIPGCNGSQPCQLGASCCTSICVDLDNDAENCGGCADACPIEEHATAVCVAASCDYDCDSGFADCNADAASDGCEHNVLQDGPCACAPGSVQACYLAPSSTQDVGPCKAGQRTCAASGLAWGPCQDAVFPAGEICNMVDDDCNGSVDDFCVPPDGSCAAEENNAANFPVDIIWVVDDSGSMSQELDQIEANINNQFTTIIAASGLDYRVAVIVAKGTGTYEICVNPPLAGPNCGDNLPLFRAIDQDVQSWDSLTKTLSTYDNANPALNWSTFLRPEAVKVFIEVTDDNSNPMQAADFDQQLLAKLPAGMFGTAQQRKYIFHSIIGIVNGQPSQTCSTAVNTGQVYQDLSNLTGGMMFSVCETDYSPIFNTIASSVVLFSCEYKIPQPMMGQIDYGKVNVEYTPGGGNPTVIFNVNDLASCDPITGGWYYDNLVNPTKIVLCPATCDQVIDDDNGVVKVLVGCETVHQ